MRFLKNKIANAKTAYWSNFNRQQILHPPISQIIEKPPTAGISVNKE